MQNKYNLRYNLFKQLHKLSVGYTTIDAVILPLVGVQILALPNTTCTL